MLVKSTLSVVSESDLLVLIMDSSSEWIDQQLRTVHNVLAELGADKIPSMLVFNKIDLVDDPFLRKRLSIDWPQAIFYLCI